jgi:hypothetical protein
MESATRIFVRTRARNCWEYCLLPQDSCSLTHHHSNLALACHRCNLRKGPNLTGIDPISGEIIPLFDPRRDRWLDRFRLRGPVIEGVTAVGRTTIKVLAMNDTRRIERRDLLAQEPDVSGGF